MLSTLQCFVLLHVHLIFTTCQSIRSRATKTTTTRYSPSPLKPGGKDQICPLESTGARSPTQSPPPHHHQQPRHQLVQQKVLSPGCGCWRDVAPCWWYQVKTFHTKYCCTLLGLAEGCSDWWGRWVTTLVLLNPFFFFWLVSFQNFFFASYGSLHLTPPAYPSTHPSTKGKGSKIPVPETFRLGDTLPGTPQMRFAL